MNNFELNLAKRNPFGSLDILRYAVVIPSRACCLCPRSCDIQFSEVHVRASSTKSARMGLNVKQGVCIAHSPRDTDQNMVALLHQIEPLTTNILEMGISNGSSPA